MMTHSHERASIELLWWIILAIMAGALSMLFVNQTAGAVLPENREGRATPGGEEVPGAVAEWTRALAAYDRGKMEEAYASFAAADEAVDLYLGEAARSDLGLSMWRAMTAHRLGWYEVALGQWTRLNASGQYAVWSKIGRTATYLRLGEVDNALTEIHAAHGLAPDNPAVLYFVGITYLEKANHSVAYPDAVNETVRMVSTREVWVAPNSQGTYRLMAAEALSRAVQFAGALDLEQPAVPAAATLWPRMAPTVGTLLAAVGAEDFEAKANHVLGGLFVDRRNPDQAEAYLDQARLLGANAAHAYSDVAGLYEQNHRWADATRAYAKAWAGEPLQSQWGERMVGDSIRALVEWLASPVP